MAGIMADYARLFLEANTLGELDAKFRKFQDADLFALRRDLMRGRQWMVGHHDAENIVLLLDESEREPYERITVVADRDGNVELRTTNLRFTPERLGKVEELCNLQIDRCTERLPGEVRYLIKDVPTPYPPGEYVLGKNNP